jgi:hypothetical protein
MALILKVDGTRKEMTPDNKDGSLSLEQLQAAVGGYIEVVAVPNSFNTLLVDEDGLMKKLPMNVEASKLAQRPIVGNTVLCINQNSKLY